MILIKPKPDNIGAIASTLCLIHCVATPIIFIAQSCTMSCCSGAPTWWGVIDYFFLVISFFAIYHTTQTTSENWIKPLFWLSYIALFIVIVNEKYAWFYLNDKVIYVPAMALIGLHLFNKKYCQCNKGKCCSDEG